MTTPEHGLLKRSAFTDGKKIPVDSRESGVIFDHENMKLKCKTSQQMIVVYCLA